MVHSIHIIVLVNTVAHLQFHTPNNECARKETDVECTTSEIRKYNDFFLTIYILTRFNKEITIVILHSAQHSPTKSYDLVGNITSAHNQYLCFRRSQFILHLL